MKQWKTPLIGLFVIVCILINYYGRMLALHFNLPLWMDAFGTVLCAYVAGPFAGAVVGLAGNLMQGIYPGVDAVYGLTSVGLGLIVGFAARKSRMSTILGAMTVAAMTTLTSIIISVPLNVIFNGGSTGNMWGDGVISFFREKGVPFGICGIVGQFYVFSLLRHGLNI